MTGRNGETLGIGIFLTYLVPPTLLFLPLARVVADLGLQNSMWSLVLIYPTFTIPFCTWLLMGFFKALRPRSRRRRSSTAAACSAPSSRWRSLCRCRGF